MHVGKMLFYTQNNTSETEINNYLYYTIFYQIICLYIKKL